MARTARRRRARSRVLVPCLSVLVLAGGTSATGVREPEPVVSYTPTCTTSAGPGCLSGTEVQALETFDGKLYAGTTNWKETVSSIWPRTSAQINVLASRDGAWHRTPDLPGSAKCAPGNAPWEQVNDLDAASLAWQGSIDRRLFAGVLANEDGACPGLHATVFSLAGTGRKWIDTGLETRLDDVYGAVNTEVRYIETFSDGTADCRAHRPCVFAFVGPRGGTVGPSVWRGVYDPADENCAVICWDSGPEVVMDGVQAPPARRIVSSTSGEAGLFFGTTAAGIGMCRDERLGDDCNRAALMQRVGPRTWEPAWLGSPVRDGGPVQVRGITSWAYSDADRSVWFVTGPVGTVYRIDTTAVTTSAAIAERTLGEFLPESCNARMLPYQLYIHRRGSTDAYPELLVASEACGKTPRDSFARIFHRPIRRGAPWELLDMPTVTNVGPDRSNEAAIRCIETSPFDSQDVYFGTTDMNNAPGSLTARVYALAFE